MSVKDPMKVGTVALFFCNGQFLKTQLSYINAWVFIQAYLSPSWQRWWKSGIFAFFEIRLKRVWVQAAMWIGSTNFNILAFFESPIRHVHLWIQVWFNSAKLILFAPFQSGGSETLLSMFVWAVWCFLISSCSFFFPLPRLSCSHRSFQRTYWQHSHPLGEPESAGAALAVR